ncbi:unnamed protein product [Ranitomeya imitator]|uniref:Uncharacterized protein n=1 Tax=Ranitomeya imitator TaxID=111125 RepID=A0ABN9KSD5_9NEOB|nr:unnamed protein product [Ranitomeya imitator]
MGKARDGEVDMMMMTHAEDEAVAKFLGDRSTPLLKPEQCKTVVGWIADNASSHLAATTTTMSSTRSSLSSRKCGPDIPHPDPPSSHHAECPETTDPTCGDSEELFSFPFQDSELLTSQLEVGTDEITCRDAQSFDWPRSRKGDGGKVSEEVGDDETQLPESQEEEQGADVEEMLPFRLIETEAFRSLMVAESQGTRSPVATISPAPAPPLFLHPPSLKSTHQSEAGSIASAKRQQAVLKLICIGDKPHNAEELWTALKEQSDVWMTPLNLQPGMVVCDNGRNLVAALRQAQRLVCDVPTRWNFRLHMLERLCEQKKAVDYKHQQGHRCSVQTPHIRPQELTWMSDICTILQNFEDCTKMVNDDDAIISFIIPPLSILKTSLLTVKDDALQAEHEDMVQGTIQGDYTQPSLMSSQSGLVVSEDEEEQELLSCAINDFCPTQLMVPTPFIRQEIPLIKPDRAHCEVKTIPSDYLLKLIKRMPRVCKAVIKAKEGGKGENREQGRGRDRREEERKKERKSRLRSRDAVEQRPRQMQRLQICDTSSKDDFCQKCEDSDKLGDFPWLMVISVTRRLRIFFATLVLGLAIYLVRCRPKKKKFTTPIEETGAHSAEELLIH